MLWFGFVHNRVIYKWSRKILIVAKPNWQGKDFVYWSMKYAIQIWPLIAAAVLCSFVGRAMHYGLQIFKKDLIK